MTQSGPQAEVSPLDSLFALVYRFPLLAFAFSLYFDGVLVDSRVTDRRPFANLDPTRNPGLSIGGYQDSHYGPFHGLIDEVRISDVALSPGAFLNAPPVVPAPPAAALGGLGLLLAGLVRRWRG